MRDPERVSMCVTTTTVIQSAVRKMRVAIGATMSDVPCLVAQP